MDFTRSELRQIVTKVFTSEMRRHSWVSWRDFPAGWIDSVITSMHSVQPVLTRSRFIDVLDSAIGRRFDGVESAVIAGTVYEPRA